MQRIERLPGREYRCETFLSGYITVHGSTVFPASRVVFGFIN